VSLDLEFTILLPGGGVFRFAGPFPVDPEQWNHIRNVMDAMAPGLNAAKFGTGP
jgi:Zn-dependent protease